MARRRNYNRNRRGRFAFLYKLLSVLAICVVIVVALTLFFRVDTITITGANRYSESEIIEATGLQTGDNLLLLNKYAIAEKLCADLPYIYEVRINRVLPDKLTIEVAETEATMAVVQDGIAWLVSPRGNPPGKIVEQRVATSVGELGIIDGCTLLAPAVATPIALSTERATQQESLLALMKALDEKGMIDQVQAIHLSDVSVLSMDYAGRFRVELPYGADYDYKMKNLQWILDSGKIESNEVGTIRMTGNDGRNVFIKG